MQESIFHEKPILGIPLTFEQRMNGDLITKFNLGVVMDFKELTEASFTKALIHLLEDGKIETQNMVAMAKLIKDFRTTPLQVFTCLLI